MPTDTQPGRNPPNISEGLKVGYQIIFADGGRQIRDAMCPSESISPAARSILGLLALPRFFKRILAYFTRSSDPFSAALLDVMHPKSVVEERGLIARRDEYRAEWHEKWIEEGLDFVLSVPHALPALENDGQDKATLMSAGYAFLWSLVRLLACPMLIAVFFLIPRTIHSWITLRVSFRSVLWTRPSTLFPLVSSPPRSTRT